MVLSGSRPPAERGQVVQPSAAPLPQLKVRTLPSAPPLAPGLFVSTAPDSRPAEQMRLLAARLESRLGSGLRVVAVSSWDSRVGKTTVAANLAMVLAESQRRVLAIDACPGAAALTRLFGIEPDGVGLCEQLLRRLDGDSSPWEVVQIAETLTIMPGSATAQPALPLLASEAFAQLVRDMLRLFDAVVVDTEALQLASDAVVLQRKVDGYVMVAGRHRSTTRGLRELTSRVERPRILGVVFNEH
jgi:Mrp family chromosome partitioning ATPase